MRALSVHSELNKVAGESFHFAAHGALAARSTIGDQTFKKAKAIIKKGNLARHKWADLAEDDVTCPRVTTRGDDDPI